jgi:pyridinium-3,5-bisthiocarboxylic acid mononucleotide nickel chelatase
VLCSAALAPELAELLAKETGTLGIRSSAVTKQVYPRTFDTVMVDGHEIAIKSGPYGAKPEFEDVKRAALVTDRSAIEISREALTIWRSRVPS